MKKMYSYVESCVSIRKMLTNFLDYGIDVSRLDLMDDLIKSSETDQVKILNSYLSLKEQRVLFGATRNICNVVKVMKEKLKIARETHENPTTIELSLEIMENLSNTASFVDEFLINGKTEDINTVDQLSRILYKKASKLGFYQDIKTQLKDAGITKKEVKTFVEKLSKNIEEMETEDEFI